MLTESQIDSHLATFYRQSLAFPTLYFGSPESMENALMVVDVVVSALTSKPRSYRQYHDYLQKSHGCTDQSFVPTFRLRSKTPEGSCVTELEVFAAFATIWDSYQTAFVGKISERTLQDMNCGLGVADDEG